MPINKNALGRYKVIDMLLRNSMRPYPTMKDIIEACRIKLNIDPSVDTIQKDIERMRMDPPDGFGAPLQYNDSRRGYEYLDPNYSISGIPLSDEDIDTIKKSIDLIQHLGGARMGEKFNHAMEKILSTVLEEFPHGKANRTILQTMTPPVSRGFEHVDLFYHAGREQYPVSFIHYSYKKRAFKSIMIHPILIKEFENKWYIIGYSEQHKAVRTFGLDRVFDPYMVKKSFTAVEHDVAQSLAQDYYGVFPISGKGKEQIKIEVSDLATQYFQAYPLHDTQHILKDPDGFSVITFNLIPTLELTRLFLSHGHHVVVLEPEWLKTFTENLK